MPAHNKTPKASLLEKEFELKKKIKQLDAIERIKRFQKTRRESFVTNNLAAALEDDPGHEFLIELKTLIKKHRKKIFPTRS